MKLNPPIASAISHDRREDFIIEDDFTHLKKVDLVEKSTSYEVLFSGTPSGTTTRYARMHSSSY